MLREPVVQTKTFLFLTLFLASVFAGCAAPMEKKEAVFFPPPPNSPRIQYLTKISDSTDIEGKKQNFALILLGGKRADKVQKIAKPYGITASNGKIYVCDIGASNILIIDPAKKSISGLKGNYNLGKLKKPVNVAVDKDGSLYVADTMRKEIVAFDANGEFKGAYGKEMEIKPADVAVDEQFIYILDMGNNEIKLLDKKGGKLLRSFGKTSENAEERLAIPTNMTLGTDGFIYVTNVGTGKVVKLDRDGHVLSTFGGLGDIVGMFSRPKGIAVDDEGRIFVADGGNQNVQVFNAESRILIFFGDPGLDQGSLNLPAGITVTRENIEYFQKFADPAFAVEELIFVANQFGDAKISVYGLGQMKNVSGEVR